MKTINLLIKDKEEYIKNVLKQHDKKTCVLFALNCVKAINPTSKEDIECIKAVEAWLEDPSKENRMKCRIAADAAAATLASYTAAPSAYASTAAAYYAAALVAYYATSSSASSSASYAASHASSKIGWKKVLEILGKVLNENA